MLTYLFASNDNSTRLVREEKVLDIIRGQLAPELRQCSLFAAPLLLARATEARFYKVMEHFHRQNGDYLAIVRCHLLDRDLRVQFFEFVTALLNDARKMTATLREQITAFLLEHLTELIEIDYRKCTHCYYPLALAPQSF